MKVAEVGIAMSGGVDSTASALLLKPKYRIAGFLMNLGQPGFSDQLKRVTSLCRTIGVDLHVIDLRQQFRQKVLNYFTTSYFSGYTPNPCMICNREIKFGLFMDQIMASGAELAATGHYARIEMTDTGPALLKGKDRLKDQSYFLARLCRDQLNRILFPLGSMRKEEVYDFVEEHGFADFRGRESQDICFLKDSTVKDFLEQSAEQKPAPGPIVTTDGHELGKHSGLHRYTIGQRRGLGLPDASPWYVCAIDYRKNRLVVGKNEELFSLSLHACRPNWLIRTRPQKGQCYHTKIRYSHQGAEACLVSINDTSFSLRFSEPQRAVAPGQFVVLYDQERVIGSGEITGSGETVE